MPWDDRVKRRLKLRDLDILMTVIQAGGMGKAAHRLNMSQPAVSKAVADLENALAVRLLDRSHQGVEATIYGRALVRRGVAAFDELRHGVQDIEFLADPTAGELRLGTTDPIAVAIVAPIVDRLTRQYPRMAFHVAIDDSAAMYRELAQRNIELVISRIVGPPAEDYSAEPLFHDSAVVVAGANNPLTRRRKIELASLADEPWVLLPFDGVFGSLSAAALRAGGLVLPRPAVASWGIPLRDEMLATGRFLSVVPGFSLKLPRPHPTLRALPVKLPSMRHPIAITTLKNRELSPLAQMFCEQVREITRPLANSRSAPGRR